MNHSLLYGHHFKGLPHFNYFENYPQIPQDEFLGQAGQYEFSLVIYDFQGIQKSNTDQPDDARLYLVIYNLLENKVYDKALTIAIKDGSDVLYTEYFEHSQEESIYTLFRMLPESGNYSLDITFHEGQETTVNLPFVLSSQRVAWGKWVAGFLILFITIVAIGSRRARVAMDRKENASAQQPVINNITL